MNADTKALLTKLMLYGVGGFVVYKLVMNAADALKKPLSDAAASVNRGIATATNSVYRYVNPPLGIKGVVLLPNGSHVSLNTIQQTGGVSADGVFDSMGTLYQIIPPSDDNGNYKAIPL